MYLQGEDVPFCRLFAVSAASLGAEDQVSDSAARPNAGLEYWPAPWDPKLGVAVRRTCLAVVGD